MNFRNYLKETAEKLNREIDKILKAWLKDVPNARAFILACKGGKRIRGALTMLGYEIAGNYSRDEIIKVAAAYEILHSAILAHDDIMDQSQIRRGKPSLHKRVGVSKAITLADYGFFLAMKIISESKFPDKYKNNALNLFAQVMMDTAVGQIMDLEGLDKIATAKLKTARYTISGPLKLGAILAGSKPDLLDKLDQFGENLGIAYQIQDDILDGEQTLDHDKQKALEYTIKAKKLIPEITGDKKIAELLGEMTDYMVDRST